MIADAEADQLLVEAARAGTPDAAARLVFEAFLALSRTADGARLLPLVDEMARLRPADPSPAFECLHHTLAGVVAVRARQPGGAEHLETVLDLCDRPGLVDDALLLECAILALLTLKRPHETRQRFGPRLARPDLDPARRARLCAMVGLSDAWAGNLVRGQAGMLEARHLAIVAGRTDVQAEVTSWLIKCEALRGDTEASARHLVEARDLAGRSGSPWVAAQITEGAAALRFVLGDVEGWVGLLQLMVGSALGSDTGLLYEYRWELATHHALTGDAAAARDLVAGVEAPDRGWPGSGAMAAWRAWLLDPDDPGRQSAFEAAQSGLDQPAERLPRARMAWLLGTRHARQGRRGDAVRLLEAACAGFAAIGAAGPLALALADLDRIGIPRPRPAPPVVLAPDPGEQPLTGAEVRVAVAVADGLSNRETADRLFVSVKTIEFHLGNIYRKLGVRNRTELARRTADLG